MTGADAYGELAAQQMTFRCVRGEGLPWVVITVACVRGLYSVAGLPQRAGVELVVSRRSVEAACELTAAQTAALAAFRGCTGDSNPFDIRSESIRYGRCTKPLDRWSERQRQGGSEL